MHCKFEEPKVEETDWLCDPKEDILKEIRILDNYKQRLGSIGLMYKLGKKTTVGISH